MRRVRSSLPQSVFRLGLASGRLRARFMAGAVLAAVLLGFAVAPSASAVIYARNPTPIDSFGPDGTSATAFPTTSSILRQLAFNQASNKLFALKALNGASQIYSFDAAGHVPSGGAFPISVVNAGIDPDIEVDNTGGLGASRLYYTTTNTNAVTPDIYAFDAAGAGVAGYPIAAAAPSRICGMGIDPAGTVWMTNNSFGTPPGGSAGGNFGVHRYNTSGVSEQQINTLELGDPCRVSFDSNGDMYLAITGIGFTDSPGVWKYTSASGYTDKVRVMTADAASPVRTVEVDPVTHRIYVVEPTKVGVYDSTGGLLYEFGSSISGADFRGIAIDADTDIVYVSNSTTGQIYTFAPTVIAPDASSAPGAATDVTDSSATVGGTVTDNSFLPTNWRIEVSRNGVAWTTAAAGTTAGGLTDGPISAAVTGLLPNTLYRFRIITNKGTGSPDVVSAESTFLTDAAPPTISNVGVDSVLKTSARLFGYINPNSTETSYRFEWGTTSGAYTDRAPIPDGIAGAGPNPVLLSQAIASLESDTTYYYRLVAKSATEGTVNGPEKTFITRSGPLPARVPELVSPADKDTGAVRGFNGVPPISYVVAPDGNSVVYMMTRGPVDALIPDQPMYLGTRSAGGWRSEELIPSGSVTPEPDTPGALSSQIDFVSDDLSCSIIRSGVPLTDDAPEVVRNNNGGYLFRRDASGDLTLLTPLVPANPGSWSFGGGEFEIAGASQDCRHVVFGSPYLYEGIGNSGIYRSDDGVVSEVGILPGGAPRTAPGAAKLGNHQLNAASGSVRDAVSRDASRVFFTDRVDGFEALFVREGLATTRVSASKTATPARNVTFEIASATGDKVAFLANYGLTATSSVAGPQGDCSIQTLESSPLKPCALYLYDFASDTLTDISADTNPADTNGAMAAGVVAASDDLSRIYFVAQGQVGGKGRAYNANVAVGEINLFLWDATGGSPSVRFITALTTASLEKSTGKLLVHNSTGAQWMSEVTPDGGTLVFQAAGNVVGYDSGQFPQAYHYSAQTAEVRCVSCRRDGEPSLGPVAGAWNILSSSLRDGRQRGQLTDDGQRVFFTSRDVLADGAIADNENIYEWDQGVVRLLATASRAIFTGYNKPYPQFVGASNDGRDVFVRTTSSLVSRDTDGELDLYDLRVGGGFPEPDPPPAPCAALQGACQAGGSETVSTDTKTSSPSGDGNAAGEDRTTLSLRQPSVRARAEAALSGRLRLSVETSSAGSLSLVAKARLGKRVQRVAGASKRVSGAGVTRVDLRLSRAAKRRLSSGKRLRLTVEVRQAGARMRTVTVTLRRGKRS